MFARPVGWIGIVATAGVGLQLLLGTLIGVPKSSPGMAEKDTTSFGRTIGHTIGTSLPSQPQSDADTNFGPALNGSLVEGELKCIDCHRAEYDHWKDTAHYSGGFNRLYTGAQGDIEDYTDAVGLEFSERLERRACIQCHGTPYQNEWSNATLLTSVTCESCHNPAGGDQGWLNIHASYGVNGGSRELESEAHHQMRGDRSRTAGQIRSSDIYMMARRCADCHIPRHEALFNAGHEQKNIEFSADSLVGAIRHNYHMDAGENSLVSSLWLNPRFGAADQDRTADGRLRLYTLLMPMVAAETGLTNLATIEDGGSEFADVNVSQLSDCADALTDALELMAEDAFSDLNDILEEVLDKEIEILEEDPEDRADYVEELQDLLTDLTDLETSEDAEAIAELWSIYKTVYRWYYHFDNTSVEEVFEMDFDDSGIDLTQEAVAAAAVQLSQDIEVFVIANEDGSALSDLELPDVE